MFTLSWMSFEFILCNDEWYRNPCLKVGKTAGKRYNEIVLHLGVLEYEESLVPGHLHL